MGLSADQIIRAEQALAEFIRQENDLQAESLPEDNATLDRIRAKLSELGDKIEAAKIEFPDLDKHAAKLTNRAKKRTELRAQVTAIMDRLKSLSAAEDA